MDQYVTERPIGKGGAGAVFLVRHLAEDRLYAMKQIYLDPSKKSRTKEAVMREVQILSKLKHPHVVSYIESFFDETEQHLCIIQDYCDRGTLHHRLSEAREAKQPLPEEQIMKWFVQVTMALQHIHSKKVLHRDLKPQNIFLTRGDVVKVGDFGISKLLDNTLDMAQTCVGTPYYLSPELCQDTPYNSKSDMWALGCLLYELCDLKPPFNASSLIGLIYAIVKGSYMPLSARYSEFVHVLVRQLLSKPPADRPSAAAILNMVEIRRYLSVLAEHSKSRPNTQCGHTIQGNESTSHSDIEPVTPPGRSDVNLVSRLSDTANTSSCCSDIQTTHPSAQAGLAEIDGHYSDDFDESSGSSDDNQEDELTKHKRVHDKPVGSKRVHLPFETNQQLSSSEQIACTHRAPHHFASSDSPSSPLDRCIPHDCIPVTNGSPSTEKELSKLDGVYAEDFEDSDSDESDRGLATAAARNALGTTAEEHFISDEGTNVSYKQVLLGHCNEVLGDAVFQQVLECFSNSLSDDDGTLQSRVQVLAGPDLTETCFFVHELFQDDHSHS